VGSRARSASRECSAEEVVALDVPPRRVERGPRLLLKRTRGLAAPGETDLCRSFVRVRDGIRTRDLPDHNRIRSGARASEWTHAPRSATFEDRKDETDRAFVTNPLLDAAFAREPRGPGR
jgi:hypothetical protein